MQRMQQVQIVGGGATKATSIDKFFEYMRQQDVGKESPQSIYASVSYVFRCVQLRANSLASIPYVVRKGKTDVGWDKNFGMPLQPLLWRTEAFLLCYGAAYWLKRRNRVVLKDLQLLNPNITKPKVEDKGIVAFEQRRRRGGTTTYTPDEIVYFNYWNPTDDLGAGVAPAMVAMTAAGLAKHANEWASAFFANGAIPAVILSAEGNVPDPELERVRNVWNQALQGISRAFRTIVLRFGLKPTVVGMPIKDLAMPQLTASIRQQIAIAFGVPESMVGDPASNYATARTNRLSFWQETIIPEATTIIAPALNEQLFKPLGLEMEFDWSQVEAIQQDEGEKADAVVKLYQAKLITLQEARDQMNLGEAPAELLEERRQAEERAAELQNQVQGQPAEQGQPADGDGARERTQALRRWRTKARKRGRPCDFESDAIPDGLAEAIKAVMESDGIDVAFSFLKSVPEGMDAAAAELEREIAGRLANQHGIATEAIGAGGEYDLAGFSDDMRAGIQPTLSRVATEQALREAAALGIDFDVAVVNAAALDWAREYTYTMVAGITDTTRGVVAGAVQQFVSTPGMTIGQLRDLLLPAFGPVRANMIAVTETTRAYSAATRIYQRMLGDAGFPMERVWQTSHDERVCPICGPLHGLPESQWPEGMEPPAHVRCRCWATLRRPR